MKFNNLIYLVGIVICYLTITFSCTKEHVPSAQIDPNCLDTILFSTQIAPMISNNCASCHGLGNSTPYTFTNHTNISSNATAILNAISASGGMQMMPQGGPALNDSLIQQFSCWINKGKLNN